MAADFVHTVHKGGERAPDPQRGRRDQEAQLPQQQPVHSARQGITIVERGAATSALGQTLALGETLSQRAEELIASSRRTEGTEVMAATGATTPTIDELAARNAELEEAVLTLASQLQTLSARIERTIDRRDDRPSNSYSVRYLFPHE